MKTCKYCGTQLKERTDRIVQFCSTACTGKFNRKNFPKPCLCCGDMFQPPRNHSNQKYCSNKCKGIARQTAIDTVCETCGNPVKQIKCRADRFGKAFCSKECFCVYQKKTALKGVNHPQYNRIELTCLYCGKKYFKCPSQVRKHNFCSQSCSNTWKSETGIVSGENNIRWKGGYKDYYGKNWYQQRRNARKRDNYTCQRCGKTEIELDRHLDVHHIKPFRKYGVDKYKQANSLKNLISLCASCHQIIEHKEYPSLSTNLR